MTDRDWRNLMIGLMVCGVVTAMVVTSGAFFAGQRGAVLGLAAGPLTAAALVMYSELGVGGLVQFVLAMILAAAMLSGKLLG